MWLKIDINNLPEREVLAANFTPRSYGYREKLIGYLGEDENGSVNCKNDNELLQGCTHYVDLTLYDI